ncbi:MAG TPA: periplasmic heavy metal sensor [Vicinamibacterales bacterium]|nr:periplasmic heavy metal sensor [Vicinamibacterales bacterium]
MTTVRFLAAGALAASLTFGGAAFAQAPGGPGRAGRLGGPVGPAGPGFALGLPVRELNLTDAQQDQIRDIVRQHRDEMLKAQARLREAREAQRKAIEALPVDEGAIRAITTQQLADAEADAAILQARVHSEVWAVLTPDQQAQAAKLQAARDTRIEQRQQRRQTRRPQRP